MSEELTVEQEDEILRAEMAAAESGTNDQYEPESGEVSTETEAEPETEGEGDGVEPKSEEPPKKKSNVAKILSERNEWKKEAMSAKARLAELESNVGEDRSTDVSYIETLVEKKLAEKMESQDFFSRFPEAKDAKDELDAFREENPSLSYDRAYKLYLAETNPQALLDEQTRNKLGSDTYRTA